MNEHISAVDEPRRGTRVAHVATQLLHRALELGIVERAEVEGAHFVPVGDEPSREVQAEKARPA